MRLFLILIICIAFCGCNKPRKVNQLVENSNDSIINNPIVDSVDIELMTFFDSPENIYILLPIQEQQLINYSLYEGDSLKLTGSIKSCHIDTLPSGSQKITIPLKLDSLSYSKTKKYKIDINGFNPDKTPIIYRKNFRMPNLYKFNGDVIWEADTIILC